MKFLSLFLVFVFVLSSSTSAQEKKNPLEGTWELVSGEWSREDTTFTSPNSPYERTIVIHGKTHWTYVSQDTSRKAFSSQLGTYTVDGDNLTLTFEMCGSYEDIGKSINFKFQIEGDQVITKGGYRYGGYDWKVHQVWKRID